MAWGLSHNVGLTAFLRNDSAFLGMGFYYAWLSLSFYTTSAFSGFLFSTQFIDVLWTCSAVSYFVAILVAFFARPALRGALVSPCAMLWVAVATSGGTFAVILSCLLADTAGGVSAAVPMALLGTAVSGAASGFMVVQWGRESSRISMASVVYSTFGCMVVSAVLCSVTRSMPAAASSALVVIYPLLSGASLLQARRGAGVVSEAERAPEGEGADRRWSTPWKLCLPLAALFLYALGGEFLRALSTAVAGASVDAMGGGYIAGLGLSSAIALVLIGAFALVDKTKSLARVFLRPGIVAMAIAFAGMSFLNLPASVAYMIFGVGFLFVRSAAWITTVGLVKKHRLSAVLAICLIQVPAAFAPCLFLLVKEFALSLAIVDTTSISTIAMLFSFVMLVMALLFLNDRDIDTVWGAVPAEPAEEPGEASSSPVVGKGRSIVRIVVRRAKRGSEMAEPSRSAGDTRSDDAAVFEAVASSYALTPREREVAELLQKGRNLPFIEKKLCISHGTAQTHQRHIYEKMGVHSRQEFLDLFESPQVDGQVSQIMENG